jgi:hypothetical protein
MYMAIHVCIERGVFLCCSVILFFIAITFLVAGVILVPFYQSNPDFRASIILAKDLFVAALTISAIAVAAENMRRTAVAARASVALRLIERWNDPKLADLRNAWNKLYNDLKQLEPPAVVQRINSDVDARTTVTDALNFFEEISHAVNTKAADDKLVRRVIGDTIDEYYTAALPWVKHRQIARPDAWIEINQMISRWKIKKQG